MTTCPFKKPAPGLPCTHYIRLPDKNEPGLCDLPNQFHCVEALKHKIPAISVSSAKDFSSCRMKYFYHKVMGIECKPSKLPDPIKCGKIWDEYMNMVYSGPDASNEAFEKAINESQLPDYTAAKLQGLIYAFQELGIVTDLANCQRTLKSIILRTPIIGVVDRCYEDYFVETKLSSRPNYYDHIESIHFQAGVYFSLNPSYDYMILEVTRLPSLRQKPDESIDAFASRIKSDIIKRPSYYFIGLNRKTMKFGRKYMRSEFNLTKIKRTLQIVTQDIHRAIASDEFYENELACHSPSNCMYLPIHRTGKISESIYQMQDKDKKINK